MRILCIATRYFGGLCAMYQIGLCREGMATAFELD